jgi:hypothetical protein
MLILNFNLVRLNGHFLRVFFLEKIKNWLVKRSRKIVKK